MATIKKGTFVKIAVSDCETLWAEVLKAGKTELTVRIDNAPVTTDEFKFNDVIKIDRDSVIRIYGEE